MANWNIPGNGGPGRKRGHGSYFSRLIGLGCISFCIPVILASAVYYQFSMHRVKEQMLTGSQSSLIIMRDRAERMLQDIEQESHHLAVDPLLTGIFTKPELAGNLFWHQKILDQIEVVKNTDGFIDEIYYYNTVDHAVLSNRYGVIAKDAYRYRDDIDRTIAGSEPSEWAYLPEAQRDGDLTFARLLPAPAGGRPQGALVFQVETSAISKFLESDTYILPGRQSLFFINYVGLDKQADKILDVHSALNRLPGIETILKTDKNEDRFTAEGIDGKPATYMYLKTVYGRTYVNVVPNSAMAGQLNWIRGVTLLVLFIFLAFGAAITYFNSRRAYNPIEQLIRHSKSLSARQLQSKENEFDYLKECLDFLNTETEKLYGYMAHIQPTLRELCLRQLVTGDYVRKEPLLRDCEQYGISVQAASVVVIVDTDNIGKDKRFHPEEQGVIAFAISNVMEELLREEEDIRGYVFPFKRRGVALLQFLNVKDQAVMLRRTLKYARSVCESLGSYLRMDVSAGIGRLYLHIDDVPVSYKEAETALQYRIFKDMNPVLYIEDLEMEKKHAMFRYPRGQEAAMIAALERGEPQEAAASLNAFAQHLSSSSCSFLHQSYYMLLSAIMRSLEMQEVSVLDILGHNLYGQLQTKQTFEEIYDWFAETLFPLYLWMTDRHRSESEQSAVQKVCRHIRENCGSDLSLVQCAELVGMSPSHLSRLFKKEMGVNYLEFVVECKVSEARRLLTETDRSVSEIANAIGYSERNLNRIFQRYFHMSPSLFRLRQR
ncbi:helix-turn-helix domain-containing protein [Paenibacillus humicola]|uniref:helix-turn-helix domain-containing protein n=1 Tax=Paenibacillus humicola TaxID=3110540 RepID=UPI00237B78E4|nr:helix-turn-helix domain-containing protein [Paenibacillus humicola]